MFYASPKFPRLVDWATLKKTISDGVSSGRFGYAIKTQAGTYEFIKLSEPMNELDIEFSDEVVLLTRDFAQQIKGGVKPISPEQPLREEEAEGGAAEPEYIEPSIKPYAGLQWEGPVAPQKWMIFYTKVLARFANDPTLSLNVKFAVNPKEGVSQDKFDETRASLKELGLDENVKEQKKE